MNTANVGASIAALNQVMVDASQKSMEMAEKLVKVSVEMAVGQEAGKGGSFDQLA